MKIKVQRICCYCQKHLGEVEWEVNECDEKFLITHGICDSCHEAENKKLDEMEKANAH